MRLKSRLKTGLGLGVMLALVMSVLTPSAVADEPDGSITIEGEVPSASNFQPGVTSHANASGGMFWRLFTDIDAPAGGYFASYEADAPQAGLYRLEADLTPINVGWASRYQVSVNGGERFAPKPTELGTITPEIRSQYLGDVWLVEGENTVTFHVDDRRTTNPPQYTLFLDQVRLIPTDLAVHSITTDSPLGLFQDGEDVSLTVSLNAVVDTAQPIHYEVSDYWETVVAAGSLDVSAGESAVQLELGELDMGHYRVTANLADSAAAESQIAVVPALTDRPEIADSPFGVDVAAAWLVPVDRMEELAAGLELMGVTWIRDRINWNATTNPARGVFDFGAQAPAAAFLAAVEDRGLKVLETFHDSPAWTRPAYYKMPQDLLAAYEFSREAATHYGDLVEAWEIWNESNSCCDNGFSSADEAADYYAAFMKASAIGFRDAPNKPLTSVQGNAGERIAYTDLMAENEVFRYVDIHAFHLYSRPDGSAVPPARETEVREHIELVDEYATSQTKRWMTETGVVLETGGTDSLTTEQAQQQARYYTATTLANMAEGIDKVFAFVVPPYNEGAHYYGLLGRDYTPTPAFAAMSVMTGALGEGLFAGELPALPAGVTALAFNDGQDQVIALWSEEPAAVDLELGTDQVTVTTMMGRRSLVESEDGRFSFEAGPDISYIRLPQTRVVTTEPTIRVTDSTSSEITLSEAERVVIAQRYPLPSRVRSKDYGYGVAMNGSTTVQMELANLNDVEISGTALAIASGGWSATIADPDVQIPAMSVATVDVELTATAEAVAGVNARLTMKAEFDGEETSASVSMIRPLQSSQSVLHTESVDGTQGVRVNFTNTEDTPVHVTGATVLIDEEHETAIELDETVAPGGSTSVTIPVPAVVATTQGDYTYVAQLLTREHQLNPIGGLLRILASQDVAPVVPAADLGESEAAATITSIHGDSAHLWLGWSQEFLILRAEVHDGRHHQPNTGQDIWSADSLQVAIAPGFPGETRSSGAEYGVALTPAGPQATRWRDMEGNNTASTGSAAHVVRDDDSGVTEYELRIPWSELHPVALEAGLLSVSVLVNDNDGSGRSYYGWGSGIALDKDSSLYNAARIVGGAPPPFVVDASVTSRCVAGKNLLTVTVKNNETHVISVELISDFGRRSFPEVAPGSNAFHAFTTRHASLPASSVTAVVSAEVGGEVLTQEVGTPYESNSCS